MPGNAAPGAREDPKAQMVTAELYNEDIIKLVETLLDMISNMNEIDNPIKSDLKDNLSGIALRLRAEPKMQHWQEDIGRVRKPDKELLEALINVNNANRSDNKINLKVLAGLTLDYVEPNVVKDEDGEYKLERQKWADSLSNPIAWMQRTNPELSEQEARGIILANKVIVSDLQGQALNLRTDVPGLDANI